MTAVTTVALLRRKQGMSASLFSKYWRDVHGMLATRIPGFDSYIQFHLQSPTAGATGASVQENGLHGIAIVDFSSESERTGLADSEVAAMIRQDEVNLFQSSVLYNLPQGADSLWQCNPPPEQLEEKHFFLLLQQQSEPGSTRFAEILQQQVIPALSNHPDITRLRLFTLDGDDAGHWRTPGVDNQLSDHNRFDFMLQISGIGNAVLTLIQGALAGPLQGAARIQLYPASAAYAMVEGGRPTHLGLRGLDVMQTIEAAGAANQLDAQLLQCLYGLSPGDRSA